MKASEVTLITVNWRSIPGLELMLKSFVHHHYEGNPIPCLVVDNESTPESRDFLWSNQIPHVLSEENIGHANAVDFALIQCSNQPFDHVLLVDSDVQFEANILEGITPEPKTVYGEIEPAKHLKGIDYAPRLDPSCCLFNWNELEAEGIHSFSDALRPGRDMGSYFLGQLRKHNIHIQSLPRGARNLQLSTMDSSGQKPDREKIMAGLRAITQERYPQIELAGKFRSPNYTELVKLEEEAAP